MRRRSLPNITFDRTAGSHSLAAAGQRGRCAPMIAESERFVPLEAFPSSGHARIICTGQTSTSISQSTHWIIRTTTRWSARRDLTTPEADGGRGQGVAGDVQAPPPKC
jgi:hypothetical protein